MARTAQWHQWLRHVRPNAPTVKEQKNELVRQEQIKYLARLADERWASKPSFLDKPQEQRLGPAMQSSDPAYRADPTQTDNQAGFRSAIGTETELQHQGKRKNPWTRETGAPSEKWQPQSWTPEVTKR
jgi:NADH dehydrogenase [ubiquinone] 1 alpha subcomplex assembly factor 2